MNMEKKILIVDDEAGIREILQFNLENAGFEVDCASSAEEALEKLHKKYRLTGLPLRRRLWTLFLLCF